MILFSIIPFIATVEEIDLKQIDVTTLKPLVMAEVPEVEDFFDITVTLAASPSNFTVSFFFKLLVLIFLSMPSKSIAIFN